MTDLLRLEGIRKTFPGIVALDDVRLDLARGEIHTLLGENGAGKSTLMNVLTGLYHPDRGRILFDGRPVRLTTPRDSLALGIGMVHQHFMLVPAHTVFENILTAMEGVPWWLPLKKLRQRVAEMIDQFGLGLDLDTPVWRLSIGAQQWIELLKLLLRDCRLLILDEPTAVLTPQETGRLFRVLRQLREEGRSIVFISHKMREVLDLSDRVTVLKKGCTVATLGRDELDPNRLAALMIGEDRIPQWEKRSKVREQTVLRIAGLGVRNDQGRADLDGVDLELRAGEILGIAGVAGNGQTALAEVLTGLRSASRGTLMADGKDITHSDARRSYIAGIAHIPEDRKAIGIAPDMSVDENLILKDYRRPEFRRGAFQKRGAIRAHAREQVTRFAIKAGPEGTPVRYLSGGNIQKVIIARELSSRPAVLVALYPTRGLDIGSAEYVHKVIVDGAAEGMATLLISEDLDELFKLSDRIGVMFRGKLAGYADPQSATREEIGLMMSGEARS